MSAGVKRSCHGCARCKKRRQKCDEQKPTCGRCLNAGAICEYRIVLKWNGRVPREKKSPKEGHAVDGQINKASDSDIQSFSYTIPYEHEHDVSRALSVFTGQQPHPTLAPTARLLLHHFINEASMISSHAYIRDQICRDILPMVYQSDSLLYATMALSALHRSALMNAPSEQYVPNDLVSHLISASMRCLRRDLELPNHPTQPLLHTIRTLCHCEIYSGRADSSWRVHAKGAGALFSKITSSRDVENSDYSFWIWSRWFLSIRALTAVTDIGGLSELALEKAAEQHVEHDYFFDTYSGYSSDLNPILMKIGLLARKREAAISERGTDDEQRPSQRESDEAKRIEQSLHYMIHRDKMIGLKFSNHLLVDPKIVQQFRACNTAYQNASLIHLYRRVLGLPPFSNEVQRCVRGILDIVCSILPVTKLSPWILLTTPIYTAGCEAVGQYRSLVKNLLLELYDQLHIRNILRAITLLETRWTALKNSKDLLGVSTPLSTGSNIFDGNEGQYLDFIPY